MMEQSKKSSLIVARSILNNKLISKKLERYLKVNMHKCSRVVSCMQNSYRILTKGRHFQMQFWRDFEKYILNAPFLLYSPKFTLAFLSVKSPSVLHSTSSFLSTSLPLFFCFPTYWCICPSFSFLSSIAISVVLLHTQPYIYFSLPLSAPFLAVHTLEEP